MANATRWTGIYRCAYKSRLLEPDIKFALTGATDGTCEEDPADVEPDAGDDSDDSLELPPELTSSRDDVDDVDDDAAQVGHANPSPCPSPPALALVFRRHPMVG